MHTHTHAHAYTQEVYKNHCNTRESESPNSYLQFFLCLLLLQSGRLLHKVVQYAATDQITKQKVYPVNFILNTEYMGGLNRSDMQKHIHINPHTYT